MKIDRNATIVDVRTKDEFTSGHFPGAINIPLEEVHKRIHEFDSLSKPIVAYCRSGNRSQIAVAILKQSGVKEAINGGGLQDMMSARY